MTFLHKAEPSKEGRKGEVRVRRRSLLRATRNVDVKHGLGRGRRLGVVVFVENSTRETGCCRPV